MLKYKKCHVSVTTGVVMDVEIVTLEYDSYSNRNVGILRHGHLKGWNSIEIAYSQRQDGFENALLEIANDIEEAYKDNVSIDIEPYDGGLYCIGMPVYTKAKGERVKIRGSKDAIESFMEKTAESYGTPNTIRSESKKFDFFDISTYIPAWLHSTEASRGLATAEAKRNKLEQIYPAHKTLVKEEASEVDKSVNVEYEVSYGK